MNTVFSSSLRFTVLGFFSGDDSTPENTADRSSGGAGTDVYTEDKGGCSSHPDRKTTAGTQRGQKTPLTGESFFLSFIKTNIIKKHVQNKFKAKYFNHKLVNKLPFTFNSDRERNMRER